MLMVCIKIFLLLSYFIHYIVCEIELQRKLLEDGTAKPDYQFLESFAAALGPMWPSLAVSLSFSEEDIEEVNKEGNQHDHAFLMLRMWASREGATYGLLCKVLKTISLF
jgi:hypothetical protein